MNASKTTRRGALRITLIALAALLAVTLLLVHIVAGSASVSIEKVSLTLNENIDLNFYVKLTGIDDTENVTGTFTDDEGNELATVKGNEATVKDGLYRFAYTGITPQYLDKNITLTVSYEGLEDVSTTMSAADYLNMQKTNPVVGALATALINYGAAAQQYKNMENTVGGSLTEAFPAVHVAYPLSLTGSDSQNVTFTGAGLILGNDVKMYFNVTTDLTSPTVKINGTAVTDFTYENGRVVVSLMAGQLFDEVTVAFSEGKTAHYSVAQYINNKKADADVNLVYLVGRLYAYAEAVHNYVGNKHYPVFKDGIISCEVCGTEYATLKNYLTQDFNKYSVGNAGKTCSDGAKLVSRSGDASKILAKTADDKYLLICDDCTDNNVSYDFFNLNMGAMDFIVAEMDFMLRWTEEDGTVTNGVAGLNLHSGKSWNNPGVLSGIVVQDDKLKISGLVTDIDVITDKWYSARSVIDFAGQTMYVFVDDVLVYTASTKGMAISSGVSRGNAIVATDNLKSCIDNIKIYGGDIANKVELPEKEVLPTCTESGSKTYWNPYLNAEETVTVAALGHSIGFYVINGVGDAADVMCFGCTRQDIVPESTIYMLRKTTWDAKTLTNNTDSISNVKEEANGNRYLHMKDIRKDNNSNIGDSAINRFTQTTDKEGIAHANYFAFTLRTKMVTSMVQSYTKQDDGSYVASGEPKEQLTGIDFNWKFLKSNGKDPVWANLSGVSSSGGKVTVCGFTSDVTADDQTWYDIAVAYSKTDKKFYIYLNNTLLGTKAFDMEAKNVATCDYLNLLLGGAGVTGAEAIVDDLTFYASYVEKHETHTWNGGVATADGSCTSPAKMTYTCTTCGETKTETGTKVSHTFNENSTLTLNPDGTSTVTCATCNKAISLSNAYAKDFESSKVGAPSSDKKTDSPKSVVKEKNGNKYGLLYDDYAGDNVPITIKQNSGKDTVSHDVTILQLKVMPKYTDDDGNVVIGELSTVGAKLGDNWTPASRFSGDVTVDSNGKLKVGSATFGNITVETDAWYTVTYLHSKSAGKVYVFVTYANGDTVATEQQTLSVGSGWTTSTTFLYFTINVAVDGKSVGVDDIYVFTGDNNAVE